MAIFALEPTAKNMKRILILIAAAAVLAAPDASAGPDMPELRNELSVSYGCITLMDVVHVTTGVLTTAISAGYSRFSDFRAYGSVSAEYYRAIHTRFTLGGIFSCFGGNASFTSEAGEEIGRSDYIGFALMPGTKAFWFRRPHVAMYSKLAAGIMLIDDYDDDNVRRFNPGFTAQLSLVGIQFGGKRLRGHIEAGGGAQGVLTGGLNYSF